VSPEAAPSLLIHGDVDQTVPFHQSEMMEAALKKARRRW
jgi:dipeptidyl aminopeptidase/acylaminoacyl peptidase